MNYPAARYKKASFDEISVRRINIIEPDGTLRMILYNKTDAPGLLIRGKEYPHPDRKSAGVSTSIRRIKYSPSTPPTKSGTAAPASASRIGDYSILETVEAVTRIRALPPEQPGGEFNKFFSTHTGDAQRAYFGPRGRWLGKESGMGALPCGRGSVGSGGG